MFVCCFVQAHWKCEDELLISRFISYLGDIDGDDDAKKWTTFFSTRLDCYILLFVPFHLRWRRTHCSHCCRCRAESIRNLIDSVTTFRIKGNYFHCRFECASSSSMDKVFGTHTRREKMNTREKEYCGGLPTFAYMIRKTRHIDFSNS